MKPVIILRMASRALRRNVMRTLLTTLGIVIGVGSVITMMEIGNGATRAIQKTLSSIGANTLAIIPGAQTVGGISFGIGSQTTLTPKDAEAIQRQCPAIANVAPMVRARTQIVYGNRNWVPTTLYGTDPAFLEVRDWTELAEGTAFSAQDVRNMSKVCLVGKTIVRELFQGQSPIGKEIRIRNVSFKVIGVLGPKGANMMGQDQDDTVLAPWTTLKYRVVATSLSNGNQSSLNTANTTEVNSLTGLYPNVTSSTNSETLYPTSAANELQDLPQPIRFANVDSILTNARSAEEIPIAIDQINSTLRATHHLRPGVPNDFTVRDMTEITKAMSSTTELITKLLLYVAMISLVVGGVGIMNIMLVSVTERTREIGLRMAVGAEPNDILRQFLTEAIALCLLGGILGILMGRGASMLVSRLLHWPTEPSLGAIITAVVVSASVGVIFGFYPAWKGSRLDPIDALRYE
jgi:ABC-type antimicrobial peptide transport system permease subunit